MLIAATYLDQNPNYYKQFSEINLIKLAILAFVTKLAHDYDVINYSIRIKV